MYMIKVIKIPAWIILALIMNTSMACEPCLSTLDFEQTVDSADAVIIASRTDFTGPILTGGTVEDGPVSMTVEIEHIFKGVIDKNEIVIHSWSGMCMYGVFVDDEESHVMFLKKLDSGGQAGSPEYTAVAYGCTHYKTLPVEKGKILYNGIGYTKKEFSDLLAGAPSSFTGESFKECKGIELRTVSTGNMIIINYLQPRPGPVLVELVNTAGKNICHLKHGYAGTGWHSLVWKPMSSYTNHSVFFVRLTVAGDQLVKKAVFLAQTHVKPDHEYFGLVEKSAER